MGLYPFKLERPDGRPAEPPTLESAVHSWRPGDTIPLGRGRTLRVASVRYGDGEEPPTLVVEDTAG
jgi:hypothetical protein